MVGRACNQYVGADVVVKLLHTLKAICTCVLTLKAMCGLCGERNIPLPSPITHTTLCFQG